jgi:DeoR family transcriptional regulator, glycerol-3-phosphate regulon repressor
MCLVSVKPYTIFSISLFVLSVKLNDDLCGFDLYLVVINWFTALIKQYKPKFQMKNLKVQQRHANIVSALRQHGNLSVAAMARLLDVSEETVRRDAVPLEQNGEILKLHGALALPHNIVEANFERRMREFAPAKLAIARSALQMVRDGDSLIIDTGTTTTFFARELRQRRNLTVITNSTEITRLLAGVAGNKVYLAGGEMDADSGAAYGPTTVDFIARFQVKHAFLSIGALDLAVGPMDSELQEAEFAAMAISCATHRVILADSSKFGLKVFVRVCSYADIEVIVTEKSPPPEFFATLSEAGTRLLIAA